ncbi:MAG: hypothetical protein ACYTGB_02105 [Planctomycetota bacterium]|jgi:hypothetical protein
MDKSVKTVAMGIGVSLALLTAILLVNSWRPKILELEPAWLLVAGAPALTGLALVVGSRVKKLRAFGVDADTVVDAAPEPTEPDRRAPPGRDSSARDVLDAAEWADRVREANLRGTVITYYEYDGVRKRSFYYRSEEPDTEEGQ